MRDPFLLTRACEGYNSPGNIAACWGSVLAGAKGAVSVAKGAGLTGITKAARAPKTVGMGRDMKRRAIPYAEKHGYGYYGGTPSWIPFRSERLDLWFNNRWIKKQMRRDNEIVNIGEPQGMPQSPFYDMERRATSGYPKYREDLQP